MSNSRKRKWSGVVAARIAEVEQEKASRKKVRPPDVAVVAAALEKAGFDPFTMIARYCVRHALFGGENDGDERAALAAAQWLGDHVKAKPKADQTVNANVQIGLLDILKRLDESAE